MTVATLIKHKWYWLVGVIALLAIYSTIAVLWKPGDPEQRPFKMYVPIKIEPSADPINKSACEYAPLTVLGGYIYRVTYNFDQPLQSAIFYVYDKQGKQIIRGLAQRNQGVINATGELKVGFTQFDFVTPPDASLISFFLCNDGKVPATFTNVEIRKIGDAKESPFYKLSAGFGLFPPILSPAPKLTDTLEDWSKTSFHSVGLTISTDTPGPASLPRRTIKLPEYNQILEPQYVIWKMDEPITRFRVGGYYQEETITKSPENVLLISVSPDGKNWTPLGKTDLRSSYYPQPPGWAMYTSEKTDLLPSANYRYLRVEFPAYYEPHWAVQLGLVEIN